MFPEILIVLLGNLAIFILPAVFYGRLRISGTEIEPLALKALLLVFGSAVRTLYIDHDPFPTIKIMQKRQCF